MINSLVVKGLNKMYKEYGLDNAEVINVTLNNFSFSKQPFSINTIHVFDYNFKNCNTAIEPYNYEYHNGITYKKSVYKIYDNQRYQIFQIREM